MNVEEVLVELVVWWNLQVQVMVWVQLQRHLVMELAIVIPSHQVEYVVDTQLVWTRHCEVPDVAVTDVEVDVEVWW